MPSTTACESEYTRMGPALCLAGPSSHDDCVKFRIHDTLLRRFLPRNLATCMPAFMSMMVYLNGSPCRLSQTSPGRVQSKPI
eukprot:3991588-Amphidinium_carterae.1